VQNQAMTFGNWFQGKRLRFFLHPITQANMLRVMVYRKRKCEACENRYRPRVVGQRFCSEKCRVRVNQQLLRDRRRALKVAAAAAGD
jgi:predicted nucleic acid-binding Zn ribbon protein